jgi:hypothetical protein
MNPPPDRPEPTAPSDPAPAPRAPCSHHTLRGGDPLARVHRLDRLRRAYCAIVAALWMGIGSVCVLWPALTGRLLPWTLPPLHARCFGAMHFACALGLWLALRRQDAAVTRIPLASTAAWCAVLVVAAPWSTARPVQLAWTTTFAFVALAAVALLWLGRDLQAPAERPDQAWQFVAAAATLAAIGLLLFPDAAATVWPWKLPRALAMAYAAPFIGFGLSAWMVGYERRRNVRNAATPSLAALGFGVLAASVLHHATFDWARAVTWIWFGAFGALTGLALLRLRAR